MAESSSVSSILEDTSLQQNTTSLVQISGKGKLAQLLKESVNTVIEKCLGQIKFSIIESNFREIYKEDPSSLKLIHQQLLNQLQENIRLEINKFCERENLGNLLDQLEKIISRNEKNSGKVAWRPSGKPQDDMRDHLYHLKLKHKTMLHDVLKKLQSQNDALFKTYQQNHSQILRDKALIEDTVQNYTKVTNHLQTSAEQLEHELLSLNISLSSDSEKL